MTREFQYIFGPVSSWRLGASLGIDPISQPQKICPFDCLYCQLKQTDCLQTQRKQWVSTQAMLDELKRFPAEHIDYYTFSGRGEPTLALNLGEMIRAVKEQTKGLVAVITNAALIDREDVRKDLCYADCVLVKFEAWDQKSFEQINRPADNIHFSKIISGIASFRREFKGKLAIQIMFIQTNKDQAQKIARLIKPFNPDEVQLNTPLRPSDVLFLKQQEMEDLKQHFKDFKVISVYDQPVKTVHSIDANQTKKRHGLSS